MDGQQPAYAPGCCPLRTYPLALVLSSVMNICARLVRLAPSTVAVGRVVCLFMDFMRARKVKPSSQSQGRTLLSTHILVIAEHLTVFVVLSVEWS